MRWCSVVLWVSNLKIAGSSLLSWGCAVTLVSQLRLTNVAWIISAINKDWQCKGKASHRCSDSNCKAIDPVNRISMVDSIHFDMNTKSRGGGGGGRRRRRGDRRAWWKRKWGRWQRSRKETGPGSRKKWKGDLYERRGGGGRGWGRRIGGGNLGGGEEKLEKRKRLGGYIFIYLFIYSFSYLFIMQGGKCIFSTRGQDRVCCVCYSVSLDCMSSASESKPCCYLLNWTYRF